ncbi:MAG TPA: DUF1614 domain-containing protein [Candidatus Thermoplasmatota archaeon]|nr:DUF1614 domain-containing protein [Candidatus Thermoplasmatota archaeon]
MFEAASDPAGSVVLPALVALVAAVVLARPLGRVGFTVPEVLVVASAPLFAPLEVGLFDYQDARIAVNAAGFCIPMLVTLKFVVEGRAPLWTMLVAMATVTAVSYASSYAVPGQGVLLRYQMPAIAACGVALLLVRARFAQAGPVAFGAGTVGVVVGADGMHLDELADGSASRIILGGAGALDGIILVAVLAALLAFVCCAVSIVAARFMERVPSRAARAAGP